MDRPEMYFDDLRVGDRFSSRTYPVDEAAIIGFAREFDPQPFHLDPDAAKRSLFGGLVASGWHIAAITMRLSSPTARSSLAARWAWAPRLRGRLRPARAMSSTPRSR